MKSTNVRVEYSRPAALGAEEETGRVVALALVAWAALAALGAADGVFARLGPALDASLAAFAALFAALAYALDRGVRERIDAMRILLVAVVALGGDAALGAALATAGMQALARGPLALLAFFGAPLALAAHLPLGRALARGRRLRSATARPPGARRAAT